MPLFITFGVFGILIGIHVYRGPDTMWYRLYGRKSASWLIPAGVGMILFAVAASAGGSRGGPAVGAMVITGLVLEFAAAIMFFVDPDWAAPPRNRGK